MNPLKKCTYYNVIEMMMVIFEQNKDIWFEMAWNQVILFYAKNDIQAAV